MKNKLLKALLTFAVFVTFIICIPCFAHAAEVEIIPSDDGDILVFKTEAPGELRDSAKDINEFIYKHVKVIGKINNNDLSYLSIVSLNFKSIDLGDAQASEIPSRRFAGKSKLEKFICPSNLKTIGNYCFCDCHNLNEFVFPESLESIGEKCFMFCIHLKLDVPENVMIGKYAFGGCQNVTFPKSAIAKVEDIKPKESSCSCI